MENPKICDCPFTDWCHEPRQWLQDTLRKQFATHKIEDCVFHEMIQEKEDLKNGKV